MAKKNAIPKKVAGFKVPRSIRKSPILKSLLASKMGREILGKALIAGAGAAAAVLAEERDDIAKAGKKGARKGARMVGVAGKAMQSGASAAMDVVTDSARSILPHDKKQDDKDRPFEGAVKH
jgi:hypothetical protein